MFDIKDKEVQNTQVKDIDVGFIDVKDEQAWPTGRRPGPNTVAYFPLVDDVVDKVKGMTLTAAGTKDAIIGRTFTSYVDYSDVDEFKKTKFLSVWMRMNSGLGGSACCTQLFDVGDAPISYCMSHSQAQFRNSVHAQDTSNNWPYINTGMSIGQRYLFCAGITGNTAYYWKNGVRQTITNSCKTSGGGAELIRMAGNAISITLSDLRLENQIPSQDELEDYFNKTKSLYGIS